MPLTVTVWFVVGAKKLTLQRLWLLLAGTLASVHDALFEKDPAVDVQDTLPVGLVGLPPPVSETVAVHVVELPTAVEAGTQLTLVVVGRPVTVNTPAPVPTPPSPFVIVTSRRPVVAVPPTVTLAVRLVALTKLVELAVIPVPEKLATAPETKPVPVIVTFWAVAP